MENGENRANGKVIYCFGYHKMYYVAGQYTHFVMFLQVEKGVPCKAILSVIADEDRNLEGWRALVAKAADKISDSKYFLFKDTSFNFVMNISDILPDTKYCGNIGQIPYDEADRAETLELANKISSLLSSFRAGASLPETFTALTELLKEIGTADISVVL